MSAFSLTYPSVMIRKNKEVVRYLYFGLFIPSNYLNLRWPNFNKRITGQPVRDIFLEDKWNINRR